MFEDHQFDPFRDRIWSVVFVYKCASPHFEPASESANVCISFQGRLEPKGNDSAAHVATDDYVAKFVLAKQLLKVFAGEPFVILAFRFGWNRCCKVLQDEESFWLPE
jgi:hypothetical protein